MKAVVSAIILLITACSAQAAELLMFEEPGCPWCARWHSEIGPGYPKSVEGLAAPLRRLDIRDPVPPNIKLAQKVVLTPTFVLVEDGEEKGRLLGYPGADFFYAMLAPLITRITAQAGSQSSTGMKP